MILTSGNIRITREALARAIAEMTPAERDSIDVLAEAQAEDYRTRAAVWAAEGRRRESPALRERLTSDKRFVPARERFCKSVATKLQKGEF